MALNVIPSPPENLNEGENRILNKIRLLYRGIDREINLYVQPRLRNLEPDFILIDPTLGISIIEVKDWNLSFIDKINRVKVFSKDNKTAHNPAFRANQYFNLAKGLFDSDIRLMDNEGNPVYKLYSRVIFTRISSDEIENIGETLNQYPTKCFSDQHIKKLTITDLFGDESCYINEAQIFVLHSILFPEIKIFDTPEEDIIIDSSNVSEVYKTIKALDNEQEKFSKRNTFGHYMVSGVPGSGKTVILQSRAIFLLKENPDWRIKIVTYNRSLKSKIEAKLDQLSSDYDFMGVNADNISVSTFQRAFS